MWGVTNPMNPITPVNEMMDAMRMDTRIRHSMRNWDTSNPRLFALFSPRDMMFSLVETAWTSIDDMITIATIRGRSDHAALDTEPICYRNADWRSAASAVIMINVTMELKKNDRAVPMRIIVEGELPT